MDNMESLYNEFEQYFKDNQEKINYFLDVLKNTKEDRWEYKCNKEKFDCIYSYSIHETEVLKYDNIEIIYKSNHYDNLEDADADFIIIIFVDNTKIFETNNEDDELFIETVEFINRVKKITNGKTVR